MKNDSSSYGIQGALRVRSVVLFQASLSLGAVGPFAVHAAFKTVSNAIELAMIASSTALMQACKREAPPAKTVDLSEMFGRDSKRQLVSAVRKSSVAFNSLDRVTGTRFIIEMFSRGSGRATCVSCVEVLCRAGLNTRLHKL